MYDVDCAGPLGNPMEAAGRVPVRNYCEDMNALLAGGVVLRTFPTAGLFDPGLWGDRGLVIRAVEGPFSAVSKPVSATKG